MKIKHTLVALAAPFLMNAQNVMTPETLWTLNKIGVSAVSPDQNSLIYSIGKTDLKTEKNNKKNYFYNIKTAEATALDLGKKSLIQWDDNGIYAQEGEQIYLSKDAGKTWTEFYTVGKVDNIVIAPDGKKIAFSKEVLVEKVMGKDKYADVPKSTAHIYTDLNHRHWDYFNEGKYNHVFVVNVSETSDKAKDLLEGKAWDSPQRPFGGTEDFIFTPDSSQLLYVTKPFSGSEYAFSTNTDIYAYDLASGTLKNLTESNKGYDVSPQFSPDGKYLYWMSMERDGYEADKNDLKIMDWKSGKTTNLTKDWDESITPSRTELKMVTTTDGKEMGVWFIYPPNFDATKKYPTLLYCQGGPQSALTQSFSVRWNFALMAANDYIVVAPNRRGMPGWGTKWNEDISKDWGGQVMQDYLSAADYAKTLTYVDGDRMGVVGASYGGYSAMMLAGIHENRFKTFIAHDGLFDMKSWYLTTEELFFAKWDLGGSPYDEPIPKSYTEFNPSNYVNKWNKPMMIIQGGIDYRVPYEQGQEAFQAAKLKGLKAKFLYFPNENHWVLNAQNGLVWQREFFDWLKETL